MSTAPKYLLLTDDDRDDLDFFTDALNELDESTVLSTSFDRDMINELYNNGALYYISEPNEFTKLKKVNSSGNILCFPHNE